MNLETYALVKNQLNFFRIHPIKQFKHIFVFYADNSVRKLGSLGENFLVNNCGMYVSFSKYSYACVF